WAAGAPLLPVGGRRRPRLSALAWKGDGERRRRSLDLDALLLQDAQEFGLCSRTRIVGSEDVGRRPLGLRFENRSLALQVEVAKKEPPVARKVVQRREESRLLVVVVVPLRPLRPWQRRILFVPRARVLLRPQLAIDGVGASIAERFVQ